MKQSAARWTTSASVKEVNELKEWLREETEMTGEGFFCNWSTIERGIKRDCVILMLEDDEVVAFLLWDGDGKVVKIDILEVRPSARKNGYGHKMVEYSLNYFQHQGYYVVHLECSPKESRLFWMSCGFIDFPETKTYPEFTIDSPRLFKILVESSVSIIGENKLLFECFELWDDEPLKCRDKNPVWKWQIEYDAETTWLTTPIIHPCKADWKLRWSRNAQTLCVDKVKRVLSDDFLQGDFLIIEQLDY